MISYGASDEVGLLKYTKMSIDGDNVHSSSAELICTPHFAIRFAFASLY